MARRKRLSSAQTGQNLQAIGPISIPTQSSELNGFSYEGLVREYYSWLLSADPRYHGVLNEPLFCHGTIGYTYDKSTGQYDTDNPINIRGKIQGKSIDLSEQITTETLIVVDVMGCFFFQGLRLADGSTVRTVHDCSVLCLEDEQYTSNVFATIRDINQQQEYDLPRMFVGPCPINPVVDPMNPYLSLFEGTPEPIPSGPKSGYATSTLSVFRISTPGEYVIEAGADGRRPYHSQGCYQVVVSAATPKPPNFPNPTGKTTKLPLSVVLESH